MSVWFHGSDAGPAKASEAPGSSARAKEPADPGERDMGRTVEGRGQTYVEG